MATEAEHLEALTAQIVRQERAARKRAIVYSILPVVIAALLITFTFLHLRSAQRKVATYEAQATAAQRKVGEMNQVLASVEERLRQSTEFRTHIHQVDWMDAKVLASRYPARYYILAEIIDLRRNARWRLGGHSPSEGFDSPGFAAYILNKYSVMKIGDSQRYRLRELLPPAAVPEIGDLIFYETGYTMFYFKDTQDRPFCIGMTPAGILALDIDFGPATLGYGRVRYR